MNGVSREVAETISIPTRFGFQNQHFGIANSINGVRASVGSNPKKLYDPRGAAELWRRIVVPADQKLDAKSGAEVQARLAEPSQGSACTSPWINEALKDLDEIDLAVEEDDLPEIESETKATVESLLRAIALKGVGTAPIVYPTESGEVAVYFHSRLAACAILIEVGNDGRGSFVCVTDKHEDRCATYCNATVLPNHILLHMWLDKLRLDR